MLNNKKFINTGNYRIALAIFLIALGAGFLCFALHKLINLIAHYAGTTEPFTWSAYSFSLGIGFLSYYLSTKFFPDTYGSGMPQVKMALVAMKGRFPKKMAFGKFITTTLSLGTGLSLGREGPLVTISSAWAHLVATYLKCNRKMTKLLVVSGAAAGLSAAFNTPIAAVIFTIEEIMGEFNTKYMGPIIITSVLSSVVSFKLFGNSATFVPTYFKFIYEWHIIFYIGLGFVMSFIGYSWVRIIILFKNLRKRFFKKFVYFQIFIAISMIAALSHYNTEFLGDGISTINNFLTGKESVLLIPLIILFVGKFILSATAYSTGLSGGLFMPVLFLGASGGAVFAVLLQQAGVDHIQVGAFVLLGMTSLLVAVIRTPFTAFIMLFEMTHDYELILPLMVSSITAYWISNMINSESVYVTMSEYEGIHLPTRHENEVLEDMTVEQCMIHEPDVINIHCSVDEMKNLIEENSYGAIPIVENNKLLGMISKRELKANIEEEDFSLRSCMKKDVITIYPDQSLIVALDKLKRFRIGRLVVVSRFYDKKLVGVITPQDIVRYLGETKSTE